MRELIKDARRALLAAPDTICLERARLATEGYQAFAADPVPLKRAKTFAHILDRMTLDLDSNPILAGNLSTRPRAWMLLPEYGFVVPDQLIVEEPHLANMLDGDAIPDELRAFWADRSFGSRGGGWGHTALDNERVLAKGLNDVIAEADATRDGDPARDAYREACAVACRAVVHWAGRYADRAAELAATTTSPARAAALSRVAAACRRVPAEPARDLFEAIQSVTLAHLAMHIEGHVYSNSPGRIDQLFAPYYRDDPDATELIAAFLLKLAANAAWGSHSKTQPNTIGGRDASGNDVCNELTTKTLEACELVHVPDPILFLRWHSGMPAAVQDKAAAMLASGLSFPLLVGDEQTLAGLTGAGIAPEDAADYCIIGCNELGIPGKLPWFTMSLPEVGLLGDVLRSTRIASIRDLSGLLDALADRAEVVARERVRANRDDLARQARSVPTPFTSALLDGCIARGRDLHEQVAYPHWNFRSSGFTNLINALTAIDQLVFRDRSATLADFRNAIDSDFADAAELRERILAAPKWGTDDDRADRIALDWCARREATLRRVQEDPDCPPLLMEMVVRSLHHCEGRRRKATADGRLAGQPLADSIGPQVGTANQGPTGILNSVSKLEPRRFWSGGYNLNLTLPFADWSDPSMRQKLVALIDVFLNGGGQELQVACLDPATLRDAREHPERHADLMVRIAGFNAFFVRMSRDEQDEVIQRAEAASV
jgi:formate C-acetyltransferase